MDRIGSKFELIRKSECNPFFFSSNKVSQMYNMDMVLYNTTIETELQLQIKLIEGFFFHSIPDSGLNRVRILSELYSDSRIQLWDSDLDFSNRN